MSLKTQIEQLKEDKSLLQDENDFLSGGEVEAYAESSNKLMESLQKSQEENELLKQEIEKLKKALQQTPQDILKLKHENKCMRDHLEEIGTDEEDFEELFR
jgi:uncharacterized protein (DUF3084 family)